MSICSETMTRTMTNVMRTARLLIPLIAEDPDNEENLTRTRVSYVDLSPCPAGAPVR